MGKREAARRANEAANAAWEQRKADLIAEWMDRAIRDWNAGTLLGPMESAFFGKEVERYEGEVMYYAYFGTVGYISAYHRVDKQKIVAEVMKPDGHHRAYWANAAVGVWAMLSVGSVVLVPLPE